MTQLTRSTMLRPARSRRRPRPGPRLRLVSVPALAAVLVVAAAAVAAVTLHIGSGDTASPSLAEEASVAAGAFLHGYVEPSGRVVRRDQGGDTVSEGQAYALLLAESTGRDALAQRIWSWTRSHLLDRNGELAYLMNPAGAIADRMPASDADTLTAWALSRAHGPGAAALHLRARRMAAAIMRNETVTRGRQMRLLAAGPWATGSPASLDPSYWAPQAFASLARFTHDPRWSALAASARSVTERLSDEGALLPPDWARLDGTAVSATPAPNHEAPQVQYGLDAQRLVVWLATSCVPSDRRLAARWWRVLGARHGRAGALALTPSGHVIDHQTNALPYVAAAAAAGAAGDVAARDHLLGQARWIQSSYPTYYGAAWLALGETLLGTDRLGGCPTTQGGGR